VRFDPMLPLAGGSTMRHLCLAFVCLFVVLAPIQAQSPDQVKATIAYLRGLQTEDGGFTARAASTTSKGPNPPSLRATNAALRALKYFGGEAKEPEACKRFVASCFDKASGGFADSPKGKPDVATTAVGLMALVELKMPLDDYRDPAMEYLGKRVDTFEDIRIAAAGLEAIGKRPKQADDWLKKIAELRNANGLYGKGDALARDTGGAVVAALRLGSKSENRQEALKALKAGQRADAGFGKPGTTDSDLETTYRVMRAFVMLGDRPGDVKGLRELIEVCRNEDGGYGVAPKQASTASATYFASIILHWLTQK
jgi:prenyltransferase beta subunit